MSVGQIFGNDGSLSSSFDTRDLSAVKTAKKAELAQACSASMTAVRAEYAQIVAGMDLGTDAASVKLDMTPFVTQKETLQGQVDAALTSSAVDAITWTDPA